MEMFVSEARLVRISSYDHEHMREITPSFYFMSTEFHAVAGDEPNGYYLQGFNVCGIRRPHIKTLHEGLKHPLCVWKRCTLSIKPGSSRLSSQRETYLPLDGHRGDVLKHNVLHLSVLWRQTTLIPADSGGGNRY